MLDLRVDDHPAPIEELQRLLALHRLYFERPDPADVPPHRRRPARRAARRPGAPLAPSRARLRHGLLRIPRLGEPRGAVDRRAPHRPGRPGLHPRARREPHMSGIHTDVDLDDFLRGTNFLSAWVAASRCPAHAPAGRPRARPGARLDAARRPGPRGADLHGLLLGLHRPGDVRGIDGRGRYRRAGSARAADGRSRPGARGRARQADRGHLLDRDRRHQHSRRARRVPPTWESRWSMATTRVGRSRSCTPRLRTSSASRCSRGHPSTSSATRSSSAGSLERLRRAHRQVPGAGVLRAHRLRAGGAAGRRGEAHLRGEHDQREHRRWTRHPRGA